MEGVKETGGNKTKKTRRRGGGEDETIAGTKDSSSSAESSPSSLSSTATEFFDCCDFRSGMDATTFALSISICRSFPISSPPPTTLPAISCSKHASPCFSHVAHRITTTTCAATRNSPIRNCEIATKIWIKNTERERERERTSARERHVKTETLSDERAKRATWAL